MNTDKSNENFQDEERRQKHDADSGNDGSTNAILQKEKLIDPGNEHKHKIDKEDKGGENNSNKHDADAGGDGTGTMGSKPE